MSEEGRIRMTILAEHAQMIFTYLSTRPFKEVADLMQILNHMTEIKLNKPCTCKLGFEDGKPIIEK